MNAPKNKFDHLARLATKQDNVVTRRQLLRLGFSDKAIQGMLRRKHWAQLQRGIYLLSPGPASWAQLARAAQWAGGASVALDAGTALLWWGIDGPSDGDIELTLISARGDPEPRGATVRHPSRTVSTLKRDGVQVVCIEDALLSYAATCVDRRAVEIAVESALSSRRTTERRLWRTIATNSRHGVRGVALLRYVMLHRPKGKPARSILEIEVLDLLRKHRLPLPQRNVDAVDGNGDRREIDLCYIEQKGAIEADGHRWHSTDSQTTDDTRRQKALEAVGFHFVRVTWGDVFERPDWVVDQVRSLLLGVVAV